MELELNERELLAVEAGALADTVRVPAGRTRYAELQAAAELGDVPEPLLPALQSVIALGLRTGRTRKLHGPQVESALRRLYAKTPAGVAISTSTNEVNQALQELQGQSIERIAFAPKGPGVYTLAIETESFRLNLEIHEEGVWLREVGLDV